MPLPPSRARRSVRVARARPTSPRTSISPRWRRRASARASRVAGFAAQAPFLIGCGILDALAATGAPGVGRLHPGGGAGAEAAGARPRWASCSRCWRSRSRTAIAWPGFARRRSPAPVVRERHAANGVAHGNADRHRQPRHWARCPRGTRATGRTTPRSSSRRAAGRARDPARLARVRRLRQSLRERARRRSASRAATASRRCSPTRSSSSPPTGRARSSAPPRCRCRRC